MAAGPLRPVFGLAQAFSLDDNGGGEPPRWAGGPQALRGLGGHPPAWEPAGRRGSAGGFWFAPPRGAIDGYSQPRFFSQVFILFFLFFCARARGQAANPMLARLCGVFEVIPILTFFRLALTFFRFA